MSKRRSKGAITVRGVVELWEVAVRLHGRRKLAVAPVGLLIDVVFMRIVRAVELRFRTEQLAFASAVDVHIDIDCRRTESSHAVHCETESERSLSVSMLSKASGRQRDFQHNVDKNRLDCLCERKLPVGM